MLVAFSQALGQVCTQANMRQVDFTQRCINTVAHTEPLTEEADLHKGLFYLFIYLFEMKDLQ